MSAGRYAQKRGEARSRRGERVEAAPGAARAAGTAKVGIGAGGARREAAGRGLQEMAARGRDGRGGLFVVEGGRGDGKRRGGDGRRGKGRKGTGAARRPTGSGRPETRPLAGSPRNAATAYSPGKPEERERAEKNERGSRFRVRMALSALLLASLALMLWVYMYTGVLNVGEVEVRGNQRLDAGYLRALSGITSRTHLLRMDVKAVERALLSEPYVAEARVSRRFPRTVVLEVREKEPLGVVKQNGKYHLVDGEGMVLESRDEREGGLVEFPCRENQPLYPGVRLEDECFPQFAAVIRDMPDALRGAAETVDFLEGEGLVLHAGGTRIILGGTDELARKLEIAWLALQEMPTRYGRLAYIDVTYPDHPAIMPAE